MAIGTDLPLFPCPKCGETEWDAHYKVPCSQGVVLRLQSDGTPLDGDYLGDEEEYDPDDNEFYECCGCGATINPATGKLVEEQP